MKAFHLQQTHLSKKLSSWTFRMHHNNTKIFKIWCIDLWKALPFEIVPRKIITVKGTKRALIKSEGQTKQKVTGLFIFIRADGIKSKPLLVFKGVPLKDRERI